MLRKIFLKDRSGSKLTLGDYKSIWSKFCFLDESGSLNNPKDHFFTVGFIKCAQPYYLQSQIMYERSRVGFYDEIKFNKLSKSNFNFAKFALDSIFSVGSIFFGSYTVDKQGEYFKRTFGGNYWQAYEDISIRVLESSLPQNEIYTVIADYVTSPSQIKFEVNVKQRINDNLNRLAIAGVVRFDSRSNDLLQIADLLIGTVTYDLKFATGIIVRGDTYKRRFLDYFKSKLGINSFIDGFQGNIKNSYQGNTRKVSFNVFVDKDVKSRLSHNEKRPSS